MANAVRTAAGERVRLVDTRGLAEVLGCSVRHVQNLERLGRLPRGVRIGTLVRWSVDDIEQWLAAGAPPVEGGE